MRDRSHQPALQGARGLLVTGVVGYHALRLLLCRGGDNWGDVSSVWWWAGVGRLTVDGFFVLAGFLVVASWRSCRARATSAFAAARDFGARRAWRLLPPYLVMLAVVVPVVVPGLLHPEHWRELLRLVTLQQYLDLDLPSRVNLPIWSLTTEVHFYVAAPLLAWALARFGGWRTYALSAGIAIWWVQAATWRGDLAAGLLPGRIDQFAMGAAAAGLLARVAAGERSRIVSVLTSRVSLPVLVGAFAAIGAFHGATFQRNDHTLLAELVHPAATVVLGGLLVRIVAGPPIRLLVHPALTWLGGVSFSLYLWHYPILTEGRRHLGADVSPALQATSAMAFLVLLSVGVATLSHHLIERPADRLRSRRRRPARLPVVEPELRLQDA